jgi:hypothetical protein
VPSLSLRGAAAILLVAFAGQASAALMIDEVENFENVPIKTVGGRALSSADVRDAIVAAATSRQWKIDYVRAGLLIGRLNVAGKHLAEVNITYTPQFYSVVYRDSVNLGYRASDATIHTNYNRWVRQFVDTIDRTLAKPPRVPPPAPPHAPLRLN